MIDVRRVTKLWNGNGQAGASAVAPAAAGLPDVRFRNLAGIAGDALAISPPFYVQSIFGRVGSWLPPHRRFSEFSLLNPWRPLRAAKFLLDTGVPSYPHMPPALNPPPLNDLFWRPTVVLQRPDHIGSYISFPEETWFFINGIMTNDAVAQVNAALISQLFHRPVTLIQNSTNSLWTDLFQCALDKQAWAITEPTTKAFPVLYDALKDPGKRRVVLIAHSQGTIIAAALLRLLKQKMRTTTRARGKFAEPEIIYQSDEPLDLRDFEWLSEQELAKLEVYCFATCATEMTRLHEPAPGRKVLPHIEHFGNEFDIVARLGMQAPRPSTWNIRIDGPRFVRKGAWGHLLNEHYLYPVLKEQRQGRKRRGRGTAAPFQQENVEPGAEPVAPRLFDYINGGSPLE